MRGGHFAAGLIALGGIALATPSTLSAQDFPNRPIKVVVGFPPGGGTDVAARIIAAEMSKGLGQSVLI
jgi:tripartite-type tricarboxylate transporter receptor subunit TctC